MKKNLITLLALSFTTLMFSCSDGDPSDRAKFIGTWNLVSYECCDSTPEAYNSGEILWTFRNNGQMDLTINAGFDPNSQAPFQEETSLSYTVTDSLLEIDGSRYQYTFTSSSSVTLTDRPESDGPIMVLER